MSKGAMVFSGTNTTVKQLDSKAQAYAQPSSDIQRKMRELSWSYGDGNYIRPHSCEIPFTISNKVLDSTPLLRSYTGISVRSSGVAWKLNSRLGCSRSIQKPLNFQTQA